MLFFTALLVLLRDPETDSISDVIQRHNMLLQFQIISFLSFEGVGLDMVVAPRCNGLRHAMMILEANDDGCLDPVSCLLPCQDPNCYRLCGSNIVFDLGGHFIIVRFRHLAKAVGRGVEVACCKVVCTLVL